MGDDEPEGAVELDTVEACLLGTAGAGDDVLAALHVREASTRPTDEWRQRARARTTTRGAHNDGNRASWCCSVQFAPPGYREALSSSAGHTATTRSDPVRPANPADRRADDGPSPGRKVRGQLLFPGVADYHQGVQVMPVSLTGMAAIAQTRNARLVELLVG